MNLALVTMLASCGSGLKDDSSDGRASSLSPDENGTTSYDIDNGCSKLSKALKAMPSQESLSFALDDTSTISSIGTITKTYLDTNEGTDSVTSYSLNVTNPLFEGALTGLSGASIAGAKANLSIGGDIEMKMKQDDDPEETLKVKGSDLKVYMDDTYLYVDPRGCKNLIDKGVSTFAPDYKTIASYITKKMNTGYYLAHNLTDENMPLIKDDMFSNVDEYLSLFSDHAEDYKDFISVLGKDSTYSFYVSMNKEDLIEVLTDAQSKAQEETSDYIETVDFAAELADSTVNALEFLVTFTEKTVLSVDFNIDMEVVSNEDLTKKDSDGNETKIGTVKTVTSDKMNGSLAFAQEEAVIPSTVNTTNFADGAELISQIKKIIDSLLSSMSDVDFGNFDFGNFDFWGFIKPAIL